MFNFLGHLIFDHPKTFLILFAISSIVLIYIFVKNSHKEYMDSLSKEDITRLKENNYD
jgi:hypothetical protein